MLLQSLEDDIREALDSGDGEVEYWEAVLQRLAVSKARARLEQLHSELTMNAKEAQAAGGSAQEVAHAMGWDEVSSSSDQFPAPTLRCGQHFPRSSACRSCTMRARGGEDWNFHLEYCGHVVILTTEVSVSMGWISASLDQ